MNIDIRDLCEDYQADLIKEVCNISDQLLEFLTDEELHDLKKSVDYLISSRETAKMEYKRELDTAENS
ncbi:MAG: hypothetical protein P8Y70_00290 [Candidatus Lokiarchaeota archaeon]